MWPASSHLMPPYVTTGLTFGGRTYREAPRYVVYSSLHVLPASCSSPHSKIPSTRTNLHNIISLMWLHYKLEDILYRPVAGIIWIYRLFGSSWVPLWPISVCHKCLNVATFVQDFLAILVLQFTRHDGTPPSSLVPQHKLCHRYSILQRCAGPIYTQMQRHFVSGCQFLYIYEQILETTRTKCHQMQKVPGANSVFQFHSKSCWHFDVAGLFHLTDWLPN